MKIKLPLLLSATITLMALPIKADTIITFDDLPDPGSTFLPVPSGYKGFDWGLTYDAPGNGGMFSLPYGVHSGTQTGLTANPLQGFSRDTPFKLNSIYITTASGAQPLPFTVQGLRNGVVVFSQSLVLTGTTPVKYTFDFTNITEVDFLSSFFTAVDDIDVSLATNFRTLAGLTASQQAVASSVDRNSALSNARFAKVVSALENLPNAAIPGALDQLSPQQFGRFVSTTAFNNASFASESMDQYLAGQRIGPNGTFLGGSGQIDSSRLTMNDPAYDSGLAMVHSRLLA